MTDDGGNGRETRWLVTQLERDLHALRATAVDQRWLDERMLRMEASIDDVRRDIAAVLERDRTRRNSVYAAVVTSILGLTSALVLTAITVLGGGVS